MILFSYNLPNRWANKAKGDIHMSDPVKISVYRKNTASDYLETAIDVARWIKKYEVIKGAYKCWEISSGAGSKEGDDLAQKMTDRSIYSGAAGVGLFFIQLYEATENEKYLDEAIQAGEYLLNTFNENNIKPGIHGGLTGEGFFTEALFKKTGDVRYHEYAINAGDIVYKHAVRENGYIHWEGLVDYMGDGSVIAYWLYLARITGKQKYVDYAKEFLDYIITFKTDNGDGTTYWKFFDIHDYFPELPAGGILPNFAHGTAGIVYLLTLYYEATKDEKYLELAKSGFRFLENIAINNDDASIVPYLYLPEGDKDFDVFYLSMCHGPVGDAIVAKELYKATKDERYLQFYKRLSNALDRAGVTYKRSPGYWNDCICCGSAGVLLHFVDGIGLIKDESYKTRAIGVADKLLGDAFKNDEGTRWYNAWTRVLPWNVDAHIGLYLGSAGAASALISLYGALEGKRITQIFEFND